jgi:hypothetical protein
VTRSVRCSGSLERRLVWPVVGVAVEGCVASGCVVSEGVEEAEERGEPWVVSFFRYCALRHTWGCAV